MFRLVVLSRNVRFVKVAPRLLATRRDYTMSEGAPKI